MLDKAKAFIQKEIYNYNLEIIAEKEINYGIQLLICDTNAGFDTGLPLNIYFSKKKGISVVVGGSQKQPAKKRVLKLAEQLKIAAYNNFAEAKKPINNSAKGEQLVNELHPWRKWIGTDESGKGDFFGPLVASGFYCDVSIVNDLLNMGVMDSKRLKDKQIKKVARQIYGKYKKRIETICLFPQKYNELYRKFNEDGKKLNELMAWMHSRIILNLSQKFSPEGGLIDKFTTDNRIKSSLKDMKEFNIIQVPRAECDLAVATASIIARYHFLDVLESLSKRHDIRLLKGANRKVIDTGKEFVKKYSVQDLEKVCKTHFKTYNYITGNHKHLS